MDIALLIWWGQLLFMELSPGLKTKVYRSLQEFYDLQWGMIVILLYSLSFTVYAGLAVCGIKRNKKQKGRSYEDDYSILLVLVDHSFYNQILQVKRDIKFIKVDFM